MPPPPLPGAPCTLPLPSRVCPVPQVSKQGLRKAEELAQSHLVTVSQTLKHRHIFALCKKGNSFVGWKFTPFALAWLTATLTGRGRLLSHTCSRTRRETGQGGKTLARVLPYQAQNPKLLQPAATETGDCACPKLLIKVPAAGASQTAEV